MQQLFTESVSLPEQSINGIVTSFPENRGSTQRFIIEPLTHMSGVTKILVSTDAAVSVMYGDLVEVQSKVDLPEAFTTETGRQFDYPSYLHAKGISHVSSFADVRVVEHERGNFIKQKLSDIRYSYVLSLQKLLPEPHASLGAGITIGAADTLGDAWEARFRNTGTIHIVVLSGYNVAIISETIMRLLSFLPQLFSYTLGIIGIVLFVIITGASATVVRAGIMASVALFARFTGREASGLRLLALAVAGMIIWNPLILLHDPSFQLSVLATLGLILLTPKVSLYLKWIPEKFGLREIISATLATQIFVLPFLIWMTGKVSFISPIANVLILPMIPLAMLAVFTSAMIEIVAPVFSPTTFLLSYVPLDYVLRVVEKLSLLPLASVSLMQIPLSVVASMYALLLFWISKSKGTEKEEAVAS